MKLLKKLEMLKITVENDMVTEVLSYVDVDENISIDEILEELSLPMSTLAYSDEFYTSLYKLIGEIESLIDNTSEAV